MAEVDALMLAEAEELVRYWQQHPPVHVVLRTLGEYFGAWESAKALIGGPPEPFALSDEATITGALALFQQAMGHAGRPNQ